MNNVNIFNQSGILIILFLVAIPVMAAAIILIIKARAFTIRYLKRKEQEKFYAGLKNMSPEEVQQLEQRKMELEFSLSNNELSGNTTPSDTRGLVNNINHKEDLRFISSKKKSQPRPSIDPHLSKLILWFLGCSVFWLLLGTSVGEYLGIKFAAPDIDHFSWLSFGRLRPVHTNMVFWGWASLAMVGLCYYVVPRVSNVPIHSIKQGYYSLYLINAAVIIGSLFLMSGINNGGGEYREYIWPVMGLFGVGIIISLINFFRTIAKRATKEIYVSNWYIIAAMMFLLTIAFVAYWPSW